MNGGPAIDRETLLTAYGLRDRGVPRIRMNFVASIDGAVTLDGRSGGLGDASDRLAMQAMRTVADLVLVGAGTVRAEGYGGLAVDEADAAWRRARGLDGQPRIAVVSSRLDLDPRHPFFSKAVRRPIVVTTATSPEHRRSALAEIADVLVCGEDEVDLALAQASLAAAGLTQVLCEGGPHLFGALLDAELVDEVCLSLSPTLVGGAAGRIAQGAGERARPMRLAHALPAGDLLLLRYSRD
ncbi:Pyrimidine reductase, riboflavin biosynthesis [Agromyces sp. CF514]|uniref:pyrimidine reductase family protein n=1 Tax=Agromyces sp. CF514 TaxID=1881031 RepID=UPI0008DF3938|nr:pyrimidine reductase family protein [Agromyces sp. CF514]SFR73028.1 Pyrimidine reductase, riboflavin biosynthesis [Agromyces sp. CF514]